MILGILRSDNEGLHKLLADLLVAARLQEGLRQAICESMDEGTIPAFLLLLKVIEDNDLIRFASVKRAVSTWIGIFGENSADRISGKLLGLMGSCLRDSRFCDGQLKSNDSIAISVALWAKGFWDCLLYTSQAHPYNMSLCYMKNASDSSSCRKRSCLAQSR